MFRVYMEKEAFAPLVAELRTWNWEWNYDAYLEELTARLQDDGNWSLLKELWTAVIAKRRTNYNKTKKARKSVPEKVSEELVTKTRTLLWIYSTDFGVMPSTFRRKPKWEST